jgi:hypothetical protein
MMMMTHGPTAMRSGNIMFHQKTILRDIPGHAAMEISTVSRAKLVHINAEVEEMYSKAGVLNCIVYLASMIDTRKAVE